MQNLHTVRQHVTPLPPDPTHAVYCEQLHTLHQLHQCLRLYSETEQHDINTSSIPVGLTIHNGAPLLATRAGELISIDDGQVSFVGDVTHEAPEKSGILAIGASSDGCLLIIVSPVSITVLDSEFEKLSEISIEHLATQATIAWRSDGEFFVVLYTSDRTHGIVVDRSRENIKALEVGDLDLCCSVAWESRVGGMISVPDSQGNLIFFERNGLRHIRSDFKAGDTKFARWNHSARILAVVDGTGVTFWTRANYYWYKKKRLAIARDIVDVLWDEDDVFCAHVVTSESLIDIHMSMRTSTVVPTDDGTNVTMIDGSKLMLTNISRGVVPPPMSHGIVEFDAPVDTVFDANGMIGALRCDGVVEVLQFSKPLSSPCVPSAPGVADVTRRKWVLPTAEKEWLGVLSYRLPVMIDSNVIALVKSLPVASGESSDSVVVLRLDQGEASLVAAYKCGACVTTMSRSSSASLILSLGEDSVVVLDVDIEKRVCTELFHRQGTLRNEATTVVDLAISSHGKLALAHGKDGELEVIDFEKNKILSISNECTSFTLHESFLVFTTRSHLLYCIWMSASALHGNFEENKKVPSLLDELNAIANPDGASWGRGCLAVGLGATRPVDRGSLIVTGIPGDVSVVLQVPRGNIETIAPRPLVFQAVYRYAKLGQFADAFILCRRQRVDMNYLVDADYDNFLKSTAVFVEQVGKAGHLSVFLSFLKGDQLRVNTICDSIVAAMRNDRNSKRFTSAILTGLVKHEPSNFDGALELVRDARARSNEEGLAAVDYLFVLLKDEERVYNHALGMYDLKLASFVAESSQMDPAEFSKELRMLHGMNENYRKYNIDMKLERYDSALRHLFACGKEKFGQCVSLTHEHQLYEPALQLFSGEEDIISDLLNGYGNYLQRSGSFDDAAAVFIRNGDLQQASICYQKGGRWQLAINAVSRLTLSDEQKCSMYDVISTGLAEAGNMIDAAKIKGTLMKDIGSAVELLVTGEEWEAAFELLTLWSPNLATKDEAQDLWERLVDDIKEGYEALSSTISENRSKLRERRNRLETLRESKEAIRQRLGSKAAGDDEAGSDVFSATTASSIASNLSDVTFTSKTSMTSLYTSLNQTGPLSAAKLEKQAEKRRRKAAKKRIRQGHPREEEALVAYLRKLIPSDFLRERVNKTCRALLYVGRVAEVGKLVEEIKTYLSESLLLPEDVLPSEDRGALDGAFWVSHSKLAHIMHPNR
ncbi:Elongator complex protein [Gracilaria domingensis]|nr:Elongator complex protein [Gracilaria domingensis]